MLFEPDRHELLRDTAWDALRAREAIRSIVQDTERSRVAAGDWRVHPLDDEDAEPQTGFRNLYLGSAGVLWTLRYLQREGAVELIGDPRIGIQNAEAAYLAEPDTGKVVPSFLIAHAYHRLHP
jgi:hypothetical protein